MREKIKIIRPTNIKGKDVFAGDVLNVPDQCSMLDANLLISLDKAEVFEEDEEDFLDEE